MIAYSSLRAPLRLWLQRRFACYYARAIQQVSSSECTLSGCPAKLVAKLSTNLLVLRAKKNEHNTEDTSSSIH
ncbi:unnamed protein product [Mycena citricolor]|uniref:Uncharacterized protein n=1 Tax=Mycena citricolor TaxID=2018698 RepID=A0AAD2K7I9_9AGAR|nr:unnamed protein product [Mycena citricolor]